MLKKVEPLKGEVTHEKNLNFAYYHQHLAEYLPGELNPLEYMKQEYPSLKIEKIRSWMGN